MLTIALARFMFLVVSVLFIMILGFVTFEKFNTEIGSFVFGGAETHGGRSRPRIRIAERSRI